MKPSGQTQKLKAWLTGFFVRPNDVSEKREIDLRSIRNIVFAFIFVFIAIVMLMPTEQSVEFAAKMEAEEAVKVGEAKGAFIAPASARELWAAPRNVRESQAGAEVNHNTSMLVGQKLGNAKTQFRAGERLSLRIVDKFIVSQDPVPILAEMIVAGVTEAGMTLPAGTRFYGEATFQKGSDRAVVRFQQLSLPNGQIRPVSAIALGKDGQPGIAGRVYSDGMQNTAGQVLTTFVGGLAAGSVETDALGRARGGVENGLLTAVAATAKERAQAYGEKLKAEREWIEVSSGAECDALLNQSFGLQTTGDE